MSIKITRQVGRPSNIERALVDWGYIILSGIKAEQEDLDFVASGDSLDNYEVRIIKKNKIVIGMSDYLKYSVSTRGRRPGGGMAPIAVIVEWLEAKGIPAPEDMSLTSFAWAIAKKQQKDGNRVYRHERVGIDVERILADSFDLIKPGIWQLIAEGTANQFVTNIKAQNKTR